MTKQEFLKKLAKAKKDIQLIGAKDAYCKESTERLEKTIKNFVYWVTVLDNKGIVVNYEKHLKELKKQYFPRLVTVSRKAIAFRFDIEKEMNLYKEMGY